MRKLLAIAALVSQMTMGVCVFAVGSAKAAECVSPCCEHALPAEIRLYDRLFSVPEPDADKEVDFCTHLNPESLTVVQVLEEPVGLAPGRAAARGAAGGLRAA